MRGVKIKRQERSSALTESAHKDSNADLKRRELAPLTRPGFSPPVTELDLNSSGERGDTEGEENEKRELKATSKTEKKKLTTCLDKGKRERSLWLPPLVQCVASRPVGVGFCDGNHGPGQPLCLQRSRKRRRPRK
ncbi:hypothetical protein JOB18_038506 [Solea senegalensis]|uniref:Uncharacterized protein n=1 Tax=Solea senegalensis TaxID=28829 RepID=A0AAV6Q279_SOLSE|nr:hypothetical protein JOB18_038506 [Solea senegalensis]